MVAFVQLGRKHKIEAAVDVSLGLSDWLSRRDLVRNTPKHGGIDACRQRHGSRVGSVEIQLYERLGNGLLVAQRHSIQPIRAQS